MTGIANRIVSVVLLAGALVACGGERGAGRTHDRAAPGADQAADDAPAAPAPPADTPPAAPSTPAPATPPAADRLARFDGYGELRFGMRADAVKRAWGGTLDGQPGPGEACYSLDPVSNPAPAHFALMIENDRLVRYDVGNDMDVAPGGGKRGMHAGQIRQLYAGRIEELPHKYSDGKYLRVKDAAGGPGVLLFETDAAGTVTGWRVGVPPQVDYVEGCS